jgi:hypothetical protein
MTKRNDPSGSKTKQVAVKIAIENHQRLWKELIEKYPPNSDMIGHLMMQAMSLIVLSDQVEVEKNREQDLHETGTKVRSKQGKSDQIIADFYASPHPRRMRAPIVAKANGVGAQHVRGIIRKHEQTRKK